MCNASLATDVKALENLFAKLNEKMFDGSLVMPTITIMTKGNHKAFGWISVGERWIDGDGVAKHKELNMSAEYMSRPFREIVGTLVHEMVHIANMQDGIQDTSRGYTYHNEKFKSRAESVGLHIEKADGIGWSVTSIPAGSELEKFLKKEYPFKYRLDCDPIPTTTGKTGTETGTDGEPKPAKKKGN
jgi:hypothetical protein